MEIDPPFSYYSSVRGLAPNPGDPVLINKLKGAGCSDLLTQPLGIFTTSSVPLYRPSVPHLGQRRGAHLTQEAVESDTHARRPMNLVIAMLVLLGLTIAPTIAMGERVLPGGASESGTMPPVKCLVAGEVVWAKEEIEPRVRLKTWCPIQIQRDGAYLKLSSSKWIVEVVLPETPFPKAFLYIWGQPNATIGNDSVKVLYGPIDGT
jgi:hypothetical protein